MKKLFSTSLIAVALVMLLGGPALADPPLGKGWRKNVPTPTLAATSAPVAQAPSATTTATATATAIPVPPTPTATSTTVPATATATRTATQMPPAPTTTSTTVPATATRIATPLPPTQTATSTTVPATATRTATAIPPTATATSTRAPATPTATALAFSVKAYAVSLVNQTRAQAGLPPVTEDALLDTSAQNKANDMGTKDYVTHTSPNGWQPWDWMTAAGAKWSWAGENLAAINPVDWSASKQASIIDQLHKGLVNSPTHYAVMTSGSAHKIGVGFYYRTSDQKIFYAQHYTN